MSKGNPSQFFRWNTRLFLAASALALLTACSAEAQPADTAESADTNNAPLSIEVESAPIDRTGFLPKSYAPVVAEVQQAVVSVHTARIIRVYRSRGGSSPERDFLRRFFGLPPVGPENGQIEERRMPSGVGSGVIVSRNGYILTNNHVVTDDRGNDADEILVQLGDGRELPARIVGRDPRTDIALLQVEAENLPAARVGDSDQVQVGDVVFAIGNPLGVGLTVTQGIVSATGRTLGIYGEGGFENFIQTDASINPGNSGGALIDAEGRLVGINSAILSRTGGNIGIGFAIPSNLAVLIAGQLASTGEVRRGYIGIYTSDLTPDMAEAFGLDSTHGVVVDQVEEGYPADQAGIRRGDVITAVNGKATDSANALRLVIGQAPPGSELKIEYIREGETGSTTLVVAAPEDLAGIQGTLAEGVKVEALNEELRRQFNIPAQVTGVVIVEIERGSPLQRYLREGMVVMEINDGAIATPDQARRRLIRGMNKLYVYDRGRTGYLALRLE